MKICQKYVSGFYLPLLPILINTKFLLCHIVAIPYTTLSVSGYMDDPRIAEVEGRSLEVIEKYEVPTTVLLSVMVQSKKAATH